MSHFGSHFVFAYILNCSTLTKFQFSVWSFAMPKKTESVKKKTQYFKTRYSSVAAGLTKGKKSGLAKYHCGPVADR